MTNHLGSGFSPTVRIHIFPMTVALIASTMLLVARIQVLTPWWFWNHSSSTALSLPEAVLYPWPPLYNQECCLEPTCLDSSKKLFINNFPLALIQIPPPSFDSYCGATVPVLHNRICSSLQQEVHHLLVHAANSNIQSRFFHPPGSTCRLEIPDTIPFRER